MNSSKINLWLEFTDASKIMAAFTPQGLMIKNLYFDVATCLHWPQLTSIKLVRPSLFQHQPRIILKARVGHLCVRHEYKVDHAQVVEDFHRHCGRFVQLIEMMPTCCWRWWRNSLTNVTKYEVWLKPWSPLPLGRWASYCTKPTVPSSSSDTMALNQPPKETRTGAPSREIRARRDATGPAPFSPSTGSTTSNTRPHLQQKIIDLYLYSQLPSSEF